MTTPTGTQNRRVLAQIDDLIDGKVDKDIQYFMVNGRALNRYPIPDLLHLKSVYTNLVLGEQGQLFGTVTIE